jgi:hypothetical protein
MQSLERRRSKSDMFRKRPADETQVLLAKSRKSFVTGPSGVFPRGVLRWDREQTVFGNPPHFLQEKTVASRIQMFDGVQRHSDIKR